MMAVKCALHDSPSLLYAENAVYRVQMKAVHYLHTHQYKTCTAAHLLTISPVLIQFFCSGCLYVPSLRKFEELVVLSNVISQLFKEQLKAPENMFSGSSVTLIIQTVWNMPLTVTKQLKEENSDTEGFYQ